MKYILEILLALCLGCLIFIFVDNHNQMVKEENRLEKLKSKEWAEYEKTNDKFNTVARRMIDSDLDSKTFRIYLDSLEFYRLKCREHFKNYEMYRDSINK